MQTRRIFRLFLSSTFSDFIAEREALQLHVYPELERYCAMSGAHFQAVDLRWGITEEAQREHDTMRICLEEIRRCQQLSPRPNFAVLLGDRYGWEPVPAVIPQAHWRKLKAAALPEHWSLIKDSYRVDSNAIPPVYRLHTSGRDVSLLASLRCAAKSFRGHVRLPYFASATHQEIVLGALTNKDENNRKLNPNEHVHVYVRHLKDLPQDDTAKDFIDWDEAAQKPVPGARDRLRGLETKLRRKLGDNVHDLHADWQHHGRNGAVDQTYIQHFCDAFLAHQKALIDAELASGKLADDRQLRDEAHRDFGADRARVFAGRGTLLTQISKHTAAVLQAQPAQSQRSGLTAPLILLGAGGCGKSALLAKAAQLDRERTKGTGVVIFERYIGGVPGTESLMNTLTALTADIAHIYDQPEPAVPENAKGLAKTFLQVMSNASEKRPLQIYLDALDQLDSTDSAWMLDWLPAKLPPHVSMVVSARADTDVERSARRRYPQSLLTVPAMKPSEGLAMLKLWLADKRSAWFNAGIAPTRGRRLTTIQQESLLKAFNHNGSALWLKLAYEEASSWTSWDAPRDLPTDIHGLIEDLIDRRLIKHENHPKVFTERALAYLTAGRFGLSEAELGRALGRDQAVRAEFQVKEKTQKRWEDNKKLPPILWSRLFFDLQPYLGLAQVDGALLMRWFHREFGQVLKARYLASEADRMTIHGALADTFLELERELRPGEANDDALFKVTDAGGKQLSAALRRVMEQPWQIAQAGRNQDSQALLTDFGFCMGKCAANRSEDLVADVAPLRAEGSWHGSWARHLVAWKNRLRKGVASWSSHRILAQLTAESVEFRDCVRRLAYSDLMLTIPVANHRMRVEKLQLRRVSQVQGIPLIEATRFVLFDGRWLLGIDDTGVGAMIDADADLAVGVPQRIDGVPPDVEIARAFGVNASTFQPFTRRPVKDGRATFDLETRYSGVLKVHGSELVLGEGDVEYLGATDDECMFTCDGEIILVASARLLEPGVEPGCFSVEGVRIDLFKNMRWDYSRFGICVFVGDSTLLSLGWESSDIRDNIKAEIWDLSREGTSRRSEIYFNGGLDLPLHFLGVLDDGRVVFTGENFLRSYQIDLESSSDSEDLLPMQWSWFDLTQPDTWYNSKHSLASDWRWPKDIGKALKRTDGNQFGGRHSSTRRVWVRIGSEQYAFSNREQMQFTEYPLVHCADWLNEGALVTWGSMEELDDFVAQSVLIIKDRNGRELRWHSDVPIRSAVRISATEFVVIKKTGPVRIDLITE